MWSLRVCVLWIHIPHHGVLRDIPADDFPLSPVANHMFVVVSLPHGAPRRFPLPVDGDGGERLESAQHAAERRGAACCALLPCSFVSRRPAHIGQNPMNVVGHDHKRTVSKGRKPFGDREPRRLHNNSAACWNRFAILDSRQERLAVVRADGYEVQAARRVVEVLPAKGPPMVQFRVESHGGKEGRGAASSAPTTASRLR
jgi:hypothetical protein